MRTILAASLTALAALAACNAPASDSAATDDGDGKADTWVPQGSDKLGRLTVVSPDPGTTGLVATPVSAFLLDQQIVYSQPNARRMTAGTHQVGLYLHNGPPYDRTSVTIKKGETTTLALAGLHLDNLKLYDTTVGASPMWMTDRLSVLQDIGYAGIPGQFLQLFAEPFKLTLQADRQLARFDLAPVAGKVVSYDVGIPDPRMGMTVATPTRQFPDAVSARYLKATPLPAKSLLATYGSAVLLRSDSVKLVDDDYHMALGNDLSNQHYNVYLNGTFAEVTGHSGTIVEIPVRRLDVADVEVTDENGNVTTTPGTWSLQFFAPTQSGGMWIAAEEAQQLPTSRGVDVVPGRYRVTVTYPRHEQPSPGVEVHEMEIK